LYPVASYELDWLAPLCPKLRELETSGRLGVHELPELKRLSIAVIDAAAAIASLEPARVPALEHLQLEWSWSTEATHRALTTVFERPWPSLRHLTLTHYVEDSLLAGLGALMGSRVLAQLRRLELRSAGRGSAIRTWLRRHAGDLTHVEVGYENLSRSDAS
jgi:hypothetical protein